MGILDLRVTHTRKRGSGGNTSPSCTFTTKYYGKLIFINSG